MTEFDRSTIKYNGESYGLIYETEGSVIFYTDVSAKPNIMEPGLAREIARRLVEAADKAGRAELRASAWIGVMGFDAPPHKIG